MSIFTLAIEPLTTEKAIICMWNLLSNTCYNYGILDTHGIKKNLKKKKQNEKKKNSVNLWTEL